MKTNSRIFFKSAVILLGVIAMSNGVIAQKKRIDYVEKDGLVVIEAENLKTNGSWKKSSQASKTNESGYIYWTGKENFNKPGIGKIDVKIKINSPGKYQFLFHSKVGKGKRFTEHNDTWVRFPDAAGFWGQKGNKKVYPLGSGKRPIVEGASKDRWFKVFVTGTTEWTWSSKVHDFHGWDVFVKFNRAGIYTLQLSGRSAYQFIDRIVLAKPGINATNLDLKETRPNGSVNSNPNDNSIHHNNNNILNTNILNGIYNIQNANKKTHLGSDPIGVVKASKNSRGDDYKWKLIKTSNDYYTISNQKSSRGFLCASKKGIVTYKSSKDTKIENDVLWKLVQDKGNIYHFKCKTPGKGYLYIKNNGNIGYTNNKGSHTRWELKKGLKSATSAVTPTPDSCSIFMYPNPTSSSFVIEAKGLEDAYIYIYTSYGKLVYTKFATGGKTMCDVKEMNLVTGMYIVKVVGENGKTRNSILIVK